MKNLLCTRLLLIVRCNSLITKARLAAMIFQYEKLSVSEHVSDVFLDTVNAIKISIWRKEKWRTYSSVTLFTTRFIVFFFRKWTWIELINSSLWTSHVSWYKLLSIQLPRGISAWVVEFFKQDYYWWDIRSVYSENRNLKSFSVSIDKHAFLTTTDSVLREVS